MILRLIVATQDAIPGTNTPIIGYHTIDFNMEDNPYIRNAAIVSAEFIRPMPENTENSSADFFEPDENPVNTDD